MVHLKILSSAVTRCLLMKRLCKIYLRLQQNSDLGISTKDYRSDKAIVCGHSNIHIYTIIPVHRKKTNITSLSMKILTSPCLPKKTSTPSVDIPHISSSDLWVT